MVEMCNLKGGVYDAYGSIPASSLSVVNIENRARSRWFFHRRAQAHVNFDERGLTE